MKNNLVFAMDLVHQHPNGLSEDHPEYNIEAVSMELMDHCSPHLPSGWLTYKCPVCKIVVELNWECQTKVTST